jgi:cobalt-zinc-cadmium efflux system outer membrane protein
VARALHARPELRAYAVRREAEAARREQAMLRPALEVGVELENVLGTGELSGFDEAELTVGVGTTWERGDKRAARVAVADAALDALDADERIAVLEVSAETARRFVALAGAQERLLLAERAATQARGVLDTVGVRVRAAQSPKSESLNAGIQLAAALLARDDALRGISATQAQLGEQWGDPAAEPRVGMALFELPRTLAAAELESRLEGLPELARFASEQRVREAEIRLARAQSSTDWSWSAGVRRLEGLDDEALVFGVTVPLGSTGRAAPHVREANARLALVDAGREAALLRLRTLLRAQLQQLESARAAEQVIREQQLPQAEEVVQLALAGYRLGRFPYRELALAQQQAFGFEQRRLDAAMAYHLSRVELERLIGSTLPPASGNEPN